MLYAKLIGRIALFTCENIAHIEFYLQGLLPKILAIYTINNIMVLLGRRRQGESSLSLLIHPEHEQLYIADTSNYKQITWS